MAAASRPRVERSPLGLRSTQNVTARTARAMAKVITRAAGLVSRTAPRNVPGSNSLATVPPGEWFSKRPVPADRTGATLSRYSSRYCGTASSHRPRPAAIAAASIRQRRPQMSRIPIGPCSSLIATAAPSAAPPHQRSPPTQPSSQTPLSAASTRLIWPSSKLAATGSKEIVTRTRRRAICQSRTPAALTTVQRRTITETCRTIKTTASWTAGDALNRG